MLWIDFKLYFYVSNHKKHRLLEYRRLVVNWFQIVFLREQSQEWSFIWLNLISCELISNCIFTWAITRAISMKLIPLMLWIDFKLYFYVSNHKRKPHIFKEIIVVNWFQIVFLREQSQVHVCLWRNRWRCELISNCIFTWAITRRDYEKAFHYWLWIDFKLYFYVSNHKLLLNT